jgi:hypothetical protein
MAKAGRLIGIDNPERLYDAPAAEDRQARQAR